LFFSFCIISCYFCLLALGLLCQEWKEIGKVGTEKMNAKLIFRVKSLLKCLFIQQFKFSKKVRKNVANYHSTLFNDLTRDSIANNFVIDVYCKDSLVYFLFKLKV
jgi:hypothetical protein